MAGAVVRPQVNSQGEPIVSIGGQTGGTGIGASVNPIQQQVSVGATQGNTSGNIGVNTQGQVSAGVSQNGGGGVSVGAGVNSEGTGNIGVSHQDGNFNESVGVNTQGNVGASVGYQQSSGDVQYGFTASAGSNGVGVMPTVTVGHGESAQTGGQIGGAAGSAVGTVVGGPVGGAIGGSVGAFLGSAVGSLFTSRAHEETRRRFDILQRYGETGVWGEDGLYQNPDGSTFNFRNEDDSVMHPWKNPSQAVGDEASRGGLLNYECDYTNDLDYVSAMAGTALSRLTAGGTGKAVDQLGQMMGNSFLGRSGYGAQMTQDTFSNTMTNARAMYARFGIRSKDDMLSLANQAYADGRIEDTDYASIMQAGNLVFDNNFKDASALMQGKQNGVNQAATTPSNNDAGSTTHQLQTGGGSTKEEKNPYMGSATRIYHQGEYGLVDQYGEPPRALTPEEVRLAAQPYWDIYAEHKSSSTKEPNRTAEYVSAAAAAAAAANRAYQAYSRGQSSNSNSSSSGSTGSAGDYSLGNGQLDTTYDPYSYSSSNTAPSDYDSSGGQINSEFDSSFYQDDTPTYDSSGGQFDTNLDTSSYWSE